MAGMMGGGGGGGAGGSGGGAGGNDPGPNDGSSVANGAAKGGSMGGPWGAVIGAALGVMQGREKARQHQQQVQMNAKLTQLSPWLEKSVYADSAKPVAKGPNGADNLMAAYGTYLAQNQKDKSASDNLWANMGKPKTADALTASTNTQQAANGWGQA